MTNGRTQSQASGRSRECNAHDRRKDRRRSLARCGSRVLLAVMTVGSGRVYTEAVAMGGLGQASGTTSSEYNYDGNSLTATALGEEKVSGRVSRHRNNPPDLFLDCERMTNGRTQSQASATPRECDAHHRSEARSTRCSPHAAHLWWNRSPGRRNRCSRTKTRTCVLLGDLTDVEGLHDRDRESATHAGFRNLSYGMPEGTEVT